MTLVWSSKSEEFDNIPWNDGRQRVNRTGAAVFRFPGKVSYMESQQLTGINRSTGRRWYRWQNMSAIGFRANKNGTVIPYSVHFVRPDGHVGRKGHWANGDPATAFYALSELGAHRVLNHSQEFNDAIKDEFGVTKFTDLYPIAEMYGVRGYHDIPRMLRGPMREQDFKAFVARVYGKTRVRKDLVRSAAAASPGFVQFTSQFKGFVPIDWIVNFLRSEQEFDAGSNLEFRGLLRQMDPRSYKHLLNNFTMQDYYNLRELCLAMRSPFREVLPLDGELFRNWQEVHDKALPPRQWGAQRLMENTPVELNEIAKALNNQTFDGYKMVTVTETDQMGKWGNAMGNCIGGYKHLAIAGEGVYGAVYEADKMIANFELRKGYTGNSVETNSWAVQQLLGKFNKVLPAEKRTRIEAALLARGVDIPTRYWGSENEAF